MERLRRFFLRFYNVLRPGYAEPDLSRELTSHLTLLEDDFQRRGMTPEDARLAARRAFGGVELAKELHRDARSFPWLDDARSDVRYALRTLGRNPGFTLVAIVTLALGIGANTAIFSAVNAILLRPLPYKDADRLVRIIENIPGDESISGAPQRTTSMSVDDFPEWRRQTTTLSHMALQVPGPMTLTGREQAVRLDGTRVSPSMFPMLGVHPIIGRLFEPNEEQPGSNKVVILSYGAWHTYFGADPTIIGRPVTLDATAYVVVGVLPREFALPGIWDSQAQFWTPFVVTAPPNEIRRTLVTARLKDAVTAEAAAAEAQTISQALRGEPPLDPHAPSGPRRIEIAPLKDELVAPIRAALLVFVVAVGLVLLIACINVANLLLAQATTREREIAIRIAVGAGRSRLLRQLLTESLVLALCGGVAGCALAFAGTHFLSAIGSGLVRLDLARVEAAGNAIPRLNEVSIDKFVLLYSLAITLLTGVLCGLAPGFRLLRFPRGHAAFSRAAAASASSDSHPARTILVIGQVGFAMVLLLGAGLLIRSFVKLVNVELGYNPRNVLTFQISQPRLRYPEDVAKQPQQTAFAEEVVARLQSVPGVQAAAFASSLPMVQARFLLSVSTTSDAPLKPIPRGTESHVSRDYLRVMQIRVVAGRGFNDSDRVGHTRSLLVNRSLAKELFANVNPIGKAVYFWGRNHGDIVGVVDDIRQFALDTEPGPQLLMAEAQMPASTIPARYFAIRTDKDTAAMVPLIRSVVRQLDPTKPVDNIATMDQILSSSITNPRSYATLLGILAAVALTLATIGIYGVLAYLVTQRTREIGIRMALGAQRPEVMGLILRQSVALIAVGIVLGLAGGAAVTRYLQGMLFGLTPLDPPTFIGVSMLFASVAALASYLPAQRATKVDPLVALRCE